MKTLTLYHGSDQLFEKVDLAKSKNRRDFGKGFYMTTVKKHAEQWAESMSIRYEVSKNYVYEFELTLPEDLNIKYFDGICGEWLNVIKENRTAETIQHSYDVVYGPLVNDDALRIIALFVSEIYPEEIALQQLSFYKFNDQVSVHTERSLSQLKLIRRDTYGE